MTTERPDGEQITHLITMIHTLADSMHFSTLSQTGFIDRLQKEIEKGGFASEGTLEIMMLANSTKYLRKVAEELEKARLQLIANEKSSRTRVISISGEPF